MNYIHLMNDIKKRVNEELPLLDDSFRRFIGNTHTTLADLLLSKIVKESTENFLPGTYFLCEETWPKISHKEYVHKNWSQVFRATLPHKPDHFTVLLLDPIDGTKQWATKMNDCAMSLSHVEIKEERVTPLFSWIWNFNLNEEMHSLMPHPPQKQMDTTAVPQGLISWSEYPLSTLPYASLQTSPMGSIAYKLLLLAQQKTDFVLTTRPKHIWDILAGTHLCSFMGIQNHHTNALSLLENALPLPPMLWCRAQVYEKLKALYGI
jgi:3'-phosphoadenosine 5'-phosphosulfate (PAPS) 3'-phosphatase